jgi:hypothetical protein
MGDLEKYNRPNISSLSTMTYHQGPSVLDTYINLNPGTINRPYEKLGGKRRTLKSKKNKKTHLPGNIDARVAVDRHDTVVVHNRHLKH